MCLNIPVPLFFLLTIYLLSLDVDFSNIFEGIVRSPFAFCVFSIEKMTLVKQEDQRCQKFNFTYRYIDDVLSISNQNKYDWVPLINSLELETKEIIAWRPVPQFVFRIINRI